MGALGGLGDHTTTVLDLTRGGGLVAAGVAAVLGVSTGAGAVAEDALAAVLGWLGARRG